MTQEILDYLLIRSLLYNSDSEELIEALSNKEDFIYTIDNIYALMQEENFIFVDECLISKISDILLKYRFDYNKDKEINEKMNYIIGRINDYHNSSHKRKKYMIQNWILEESQNRELPLCYRTLPNLLGLISMDAAYFQGMMSTEPFNVGYVVEYVSIINIIMNKFPECFSTNPMFLEVTKQNLEILMDKRELSRIDSKMVKKALKKIELQYSPSKTKTFKKL